MGFVCMCSGSRDINKITKNLEFLQNEFSGKNCASPFILRRKGLQGNQCYPTFSIKIDAAVRTVLTNDWA